MRILLIIIAVLAVCTSPAQAQHPCDPYAPYYHRTMPNSLGSRMADVFFFVFSAPVAVAVVGGPRRNVVNPQGRRARVSTAACMPISTARHFTAGQPAHAEHWRIE